MRRAFVAIRRHGLTDRHSLHNQLLRTRTTSHRSPSFWRQLQLTFGSGLIYKLYVLHSQIDALGLEVEVRTVARPIIPPN